MNIFKQTECLCNLNGRTTNAAELRLRRGNHHHFLCPAWTTRDFAARGELQSKVEDYDYVSAYPTNLNAMSPSPTNLNDPDIGFAPYYSIEEWNMDNLPEEIELSEGCPACGSVFVSLVGQLWLTTSERYIPLAACYLAHLVSITPSAGESLLCHEPDLERRYKAHLGMIGTLVEATGACVLTALAANSVYGKLDVLPGAP